MIIGNIGALGHMLYLNLTNVPVPQQHYEVFSSPEPWLFLISTISWIGGQVPSVVLSVFSSTLPIKLTQACKTYLLECSDSWSQSLVWQLCKLRTIFCGSCLIFFQATAKTVMTHSSEMTTSFDSVVPSPDMPTLDLTMASGTEVSSLATSLKAAGGHYFVYSLNALN